MHSAGLARFRGYIFRPGLHLDAILFPHQRNTKPEDLKSLQNHFTYNQSPLPNQNNHPPKWVLASAPVLPLATAALAALALPAEYVPPSALLGLQQK